MDDFKMIARKICVAVLVSALPSLAGVEAAGAAPNVWKSHGPGGGTINALAIDPKTSTTLYTGTRGGVFMEHGSIGCEIWALAIDPQTPTTLYAASATVCKPGGPGVYKSTDGDATWSAVNAGLTTPIVGALAIDPRAPTTVYAGTSYGGVFKSTDGGGSWSTFNDGLTNLFVTALVIDPKTPVNLWAGTAGGGVFVMELE